MRSGVLPPVLLAVVLSQSAVHAGLNDCDTSLRNVGTTNSDRPAIVWNGSDHALAWEKNFAGDDQVMFARVNAAGHVIGGEMQVTTASSDSHQIDLVSNGNGYGVVWQDDRDGSDAIYFTLLSTTGVKLIGDVRLSPLPNPASSPSLVWTGSEYGVAWYDRSGWDTIYFTRLDGFGNEIGTEIAVSPAADVLSRSPSLAWSGSSYGLLWTEGSSHLGFTRLDASGQPQGSVVLTATGSGGPHSTDLVWDGFGYGAVWNKTNKIYFARLAPNGFAISPLFLVGSAVSVTSPAVEWNGSQYGVAYSNGEMVLNRRSAFGNSIGEDVVVMPGGSQNWLGVVWNGASYRATADSGSDIQFADFVCSCDTTDDDGDGFSRCEGECDDSIASTYPGAPEFCDGNNNSCRDNVLPGEIDNDGDNYVECEGWDDTQGDQPAVLGGGDCDDSNSSAFPGALEICDRIDTDCDGLKDLDDPDLIASRDSDQDMLLDCWEVYGIDVDEPDLICRPDVFGECDLPLDRAPFNADPNRRDLYVEVDYMDCRVGGCDPSHQGPLSHGPSADTLGLLKQAFSAQDIALHFIGEQGDLDEALPEINPIVFGPSSGGGAADDFWDLKWGSALPQDPCAPGSGAHFGTVADRLSENCADRLDAKRRFFRYVILGHSSPVGWGTAENLGNDLLLGLGGADRARAVQTLAERWSTEFEAEAAESEAGIFMHALGHSLGLGHGGVNGSGAAVETPECRPNHFSVMNFTRTWNGAGAAIGISGVTDGTTIRTARALEFGKEKATDPVDLDELALSENDDPADGSPLFIFGGGNGTPNVARASGDVDWNLDGSISGGAVQRDVTFVEFGPGSLACPVSPGEILEQHDEWEVLQLDVPLTPGTLDTPPPLPGVGDRTFPTIEPGAAEFLNGGLGAIDSDGDGVNNLQDVCPLAPDASQPDLDLDGHGDACDCQPTLAGAWAVPSEVRRLQMTDIFSMQWDDPSFPGASPGPLYDVVRSNTASDFIAATCLESNDTDFAAVDFTLPTPGDLFFYLIRAETPCPDGLGTLGRGTNINPVRTAPDCI